MQVKRAGAMLLAAAVAAAISGCRGSVVRASEGDIPTGKIQKSDMQIKVFMDGTLRTLRSDQVTAPAVAGGSLQIVKLAPTGTMVHTGDVVLEFDPSQQEYNLGQSRSDLAEAQEEIEKAKADAAVQAAQDQMALLKAKFDVRQAELEVSKNEIVSQIDAQKNVLALAEAKRALAQLQQDIQSHATSNEAALALSLEKQNKARIGMQTAEQNIQNMTIKAHLDGLAVVRGNRDATGGFFFTGMSLPDYQIGDQASAGSTIAEVIDIGKLEVSGQVGEADRANLKPGESVEVRVDALPGEKFTGKVQSIAGATARQFFDDNTQRKFEATIALDSSDTRLRPGFAAKLTIFGEQMSGAYSIPREAVFQHNGKPIAYVKSSKGFEPKEVKVRAYDEGRAVVEGLAPDTEVALVNPETRTPGKEKEAGAAQPITPGGK
ncbi:MAG TPA: efflux RND transporter periplasmic adaptor subunit [Candidatus Acidoferrum sp.]|nr:efflux RND transporter periplasmic adaptor subunit [Candidatus Acidoferrum sp.]